MAQGVLMPKAGITVEECVITEWHKKKGDQVKVGDILFTYETDKAAFECESTAEGELLEIFYEDGDEVPVLVNVCAIGKPGDSIVGLKEGTAPAAAPAPAPEATAVPVAAPVVAAAPAATGPANPNAKVSPRARKAAKDLGVDATAATPTGPHGRIIEADVKAYAASAPAPVVAPAPAVAPAAPAEAAPAPAAAAEVEYVDVKFSGVRKATAKAMVKSLSTMAQLTHYHTFDATALMNLRKQIKANGEAMGMPNITLNDMVMFAVSRIILNHSDLNAIMPEDNVLRKYTNVHLGMAVDTPKGLMVPTIFNANKMTLSELCVEAKRLAKICQEGKATPDMLSGASFTVSNVGSLGVEMFTPVVNPPQVGILGVCGITTRVKEVNGEIKTYPAMGLCLSYDHRALDGTPASKFVKELCTALENISLLMMK
ncbi:2-oxo acid dehydrogenase subunit E2 [bacterium 1XD21-13]|nr:2-oxo acid dehydrogenase subunit E2 [bacterium 1XD21-13]